MNERRDRIRVHIESKEYSVVGGGFQDMLAAVKQIVGRRFVGELKVWQLPGTAEDIKNQLEISGYALEGGTPAAGAPPGPQPLASGSGGDRIRILVGEHRLAVVGGEFREMLEAVKNLPGRRFNGEAKIWEIPGDVGVIKGMVEAAGFQLDGADNLDISPTSPMEPPRFAKTSVSPPQPSPFEEPDFLDDDDLPEIEPPDWWDDDRMPPPGPLDDLDAAEDISLPDEPPPFEAGPPSAPLPAAPKQQAGRDEGDRIRLRLGETPLVVTGGSFQEMLAAIKAIPGRRFNGQEKVWEIPDDVTLDSVEQALRAAGFALLPG